MSEARPPRQTWIQDAARRPAGRSLPSALAVLAVLLLVWWQAARWYEAQLVSEQKAQAAVRASLRGSALSLAIERRLALLHGLHAYVVAKAQSPDFDASFQLFAAELYTAANLRGVRSIAVAPNGVVRYVYPLEGNERLLGYAPLNDPRPAVRRDVERTIATHQIVVSGPLELTQSGEGLIARQAVFIPVQEGQVETFWGLVNVSLDLSPILDEIEQVDANPIVLEYALRDATGLVFYGPPEVFDRDPVIHQISLPEGAWELASVPVGGWKGTMVGPLRVFEIAGLIIAGLLAGLTFLLANHQIALAQAFDRQKAIADENVRLYEQSRRLASLEERQRLARELHDSVSQALYGIGLGARTARAWLDRDPARAAQPLEYVLSLAEAGLAEMRALILELRPDSLAEEGLTSALAKQAAALHARHMLEIETNLGAEPDLPVEVKEALYRVAQEALNNVVRHAHADHAWLRLAQEEEMVVLAVEDDGVGFDPHGHYPGHMGLHSMQERVQGLGGTLDIDSAPGQGTRLHIRIPMALAD